MLLQANAKRSALPHNEKEEQKTLSPKESTIKLNISVLLPELVNALKCPNPEVTHMARSEAWSFEAGRLIKCIT